MDGVLKMMAEWLEFLRCPRTGAKLTWDTNQLVSEQDGHIYSVALGIPDFRTFDPPYMSRQQEVAIAMQLHNASEYMSYPELVEYFERELLAKRNSESIEKGIEHRLKLRERSPTRLQQLLDAAKSGSPDGNVLDLGCGSGEAISALIKSGAQFVVGMDISLTELILAKKLLSEQGIDACLVAGCAERMPFCQDCFEFVYSPDVIEHVSDQNLYLTEIKRIIKPGGSAVLNSPNRYSLVCPEPHVGIWFLTFLPRKWVDPVCRMLGKGPYIGKRLLSLLELHHLLEKHFVKFQVSSRQANSEASSIPGKIFYALRPWSEKLFAIVADQHIVLVTKSSKK
jgi:ubiquinone/menaquinone biosynthesis C-methylase UbiE